MRHRHPSPPVEYQDDAAFRRSVRFKRALRAERRTDTIGSPSRCCRLTAKERLARVAFGPEEVPGPGQPQVRRNARRCQDKFRQRFLGRESRDGRVILIAAWSLPQAVALWSRWWSPEIERAYTSAYEGSKAVMVATAGLGNSPHVSGSWDQLLESEALKSHFERLTLGTGRAHDLKATEPLAIRG